jgi:beta-phosphoglucomutase-like phosphatase (HAD superfamily)
VKAALAAGMRVVAVPSEGQNFTAPVPHLRLAALQQFAREHALALNG